MIPIGKLKTIKYSLLLNFPRVVLAYPIYLSAFFFLLKFDKTFFKVLRIILILIIFFIINYFFYQTSITSALIEILFLTPFLLYLFGAKFKKKFSAKDFISTLNLVAFIFSVVNLISQGFPQKLPYIHFSPDYYSSFFGMGGAKIVTIIGFFGLNNSLFLKDRQPIDIFISGINFILPNFILGIVCGFITFFLIALRKKSNILLIITAILVSFLSFFYSYINNRINNVNSEVIDTIGLHPKIFAHLMVFEGYYEDPSLLFVGSGVGQFSSVPAVWSSELIRLDAAHEVPKIGDLKMSEIHNKYYSRRFGLIKLTKYSLSSSFNKPYTGITTMLLELGLPLTIFLLIKLFDKFRRETQNLNRAALLFFMLLMFLDVWQDNLWMSICLIAVNSIQQIDE